MARAAGGIHHRFGIGEGFVVIVDEWESAGHFQQFFGQPELQAFIGQVGADPAPPEIIIAAAVSSPDQYRGLCGERRPGRGRRPGRRRVVRGCGAASTPDPAACGPRPAVPSRDGQELRSAGALGLGLGATSSTSNPSAFSR
jgi:hypothetical protein